MKELNIEQKAQRYNEAISMAKKFYTPDSNNVNLKATLEMIFPELKESEGERIRNGLIAYFRAGKCENISSYHGISTNDILAWLEKQGEPVEINPTEFDTRLQALIGKFDSLPKEELIGSLSFWLNVVHNNGTYKPAEKQGEQKPADESSAFKDKLLELFQRFRWYCKDETPTNGDIIDYVDAHIQELIDTIQKPANKVEPTDYNSIDPHFGKPIDKTEPKFHEGDWITNGDYTWKIVEVKPLDYILQSQDGNIVDDTILHVDEQFHSFTIKDAKDGDVLCTYECGKPKIVFILKGTPKKHYALSYHCYYNIMYPHFEADSEKGCLAPKDEDVKPATKEQRDTLMKAMADAGYTFDFDKKELKKVTNKRPTLSDFFKAEYERGKADAQKSTEWSEEDDNCLSTIIAEFSKCAGKSVSKDEWMRCNDFLNSLKDRVHPQQEWSEEDESILQGIWDEILANKHNAKECEWKTYDKFLDWLKSLRPKKHWKPSEEQLKSLKGVIDVGYFTSYPNALETLYEQLKQL